MLLLYINRLSKQTMHAMRYEVRLYGIAALHQFWTEASSDPFGRKGDLLEQS